MLTPDQSTGQPLSAACDEISRRLAEFRERGDERGYTVNSPIPTRCEIAEVIHDVVCPGGQRCERRPHAEQNQQAAAVLATFDILRRTESS